MTLTFWWGSQIIKKQLNNIYNVWGGCVCGVGIVGGVAREDLNERRTVV
jgi:hypothetical protein